ncbi:MAG: hypothetical protein B6I22_10860 [Desulfobacteraceae bacterium 4572_123]|nr:MAG: hypothetical protein B6I22_10860 [Desulfobacteraceae bacterium 4572_123]
MIEIFILKLTLVPSKLRTGINTGKRCISPWKSLKNRKKSLNVQSGDMVMSLHKPPHRYTLFFHDIIKT